MSASPVTALLQTEVEKIIPKRQELIAIPKDASLADCLKLLHKNGIYSAPVYTKKSLFGIEEGFVGFIDLTDLIFWIVSAFEETELLGNEFDAMNIDTDKELRFRAAKASSVVDLSKRNPFVKVSVTNKLVDAMKKLVETNANRVVLISSFRKKAVGILSASDILEFLSRHLHMTLSYAELPVGDYLKSAFKEVVTIKATDPAIEGFKLMVQKNISGIGIVNEDSTLANVLSAKDLKVVQGKAFSLLFQPVNKLLEEKIKRSFQFVTVSPQDNLKTVIDKFVALKIHRLFITTEENKPIGVITPSDIIKSFMEYCQK